MHPYGNSFARIVLGTGVKPSRQHSSKSKRSLPHLKSSHITTSTVKLSLPQMRHQQGWEQFFFKHKIMDSAVPSVTSPDPSVMLKGTMQSLPQRGVRPWTQVYPGNRSQATWSTPHYNRLVQDAPSNTALPPSNDAIQPRSLPRSW